MGRRFLPPLLLALLSACHPDSTPTPNDPGTSPTDTVAPLAASAAPAGETAEQRERRLQATFPAQQRTIAAAEVLTRGQAIYDVNCRSCHGQDLRGGDLGGPNLLRSEIVLADQAGELIGDVVREGRPSPTGGTPMPPLPLDSAEMQAVAAYIHSVAARAPGQGAPPPGEDPEELDILVGDAGQGQLFFEQRCTGCHSVTGDLQGIASRIPTPENLQNSWVAGRRFGPADPQADPARRTVHVTVSLSNGESIRGALGRRDDFVISLTDTSGQYRSFSLHGSQDPAVTGIEMQDPLAEHRTLLSELTDATMHNVTAYLVTLK